MNDTPIFGALRHARLKIGTGRVQLVKATGTGVRAEEHCRGGPVAEDRASSVVQLLVD